MNLETLMYKDEKGGVRFEINGIKEKILNFITKRSFWAIFSIIMGFFITITLAIAVPSWMAVAKTIYQYTPIETTNRLTNRISRLEERYNHVVDVMETIRKDQHDILEEMRKLSGEIAGKDQKQIIRREYDYKSDERVHLD